MQTVGVRSKRIEMIIYIVQLIGLLLFIAGMVWTALIVLGVL